MKKTYGNLKTVLIALLSLVLVFSVVFASIAVAQPAADPIEVTSGDKSLTVSLDAQRLEELSAEMLKTKGKELVSALEDLLLKQLMPEDTSGIATVANNVLPEKYADKLREMLEEDGALEKYLNGEYDLLIKQAAAKYLETHEGDIDIDAVVAEVSGIVTEVIAQYETTRPDYFEELTDKNKSKIEELKQTVEAIADGAPALTIEDVIAALETLEIGGYAIRDNGVWSASAVKDLIFDFAKKLKAVDEEFVISYPVHIEMPFGSADITLTVQFTEYNGSALQTLFNYAKQIADLGKKDGAWTLDVNVPENVLQIFAYLPENAQKDLFDASSKTVEEMFDVIDGYTADEIKDILANIDYQGMFAALLDSELPETDAITETMYRLTKTAASKKDVASLEETLKNFGLGVPAKLEGAAQQVLDKLQNLGAASWSKAQFTDFLKTRSNAETKDLVSKLDGSAFEAIQEYIAKLKDYIPEEFGGIALTDIAENGKLSWSGTVDIMGVDYDPLLDKIARSISNAFGVDKVMLDKAISWIDNNVKYENVALRVNADLPEISNVTYSYDGKSVTGLLPNGVSLETFAPSTTGKDGKKIVAWYDGKAVADEVNGDATYTAVTEFDAEIEVDGITETAGEYTKAYDKQSFKLTAYAVGGEGNKSYTYQWYYKADATAAAQPLSGATSATLTRNGDVSDSGIYYCTIVSATVKTNKFNTEEVTVTINRKSFTLTSDIWDYTSALTYTGQEQTVKLTSEAEAALNAEFGPKWTIKGNTATEAGTYTAKVEVDGSLTANYAIDIPELAWEIKAEPDKPPVDPDKPDDPDNPDNPDDPTKPVDPNGEIGHEFTLIVDGTSVTVKDLTGAVDKSYILAGGNSEYGIGYFKETLQAANKNANATILQIIDLHFTNASGATQNVSGTFEVTLTNNDIFGSVAQEDIIVIHIHESKQTLVTASADNGTVKFTVENFSDIAIMSNVASNTDEVDAWWIWLLLAIIIILNIVIILLLLLRKKDENEPTEPETEETEEAEAEDQPETEEQPEEETAAAEAAEVEEIEKIEEIEEIEPETQPTTPAAIVMPVAEGERTALDYSFTARLSQADSSVKSNYYTIKGELLSYKKIRSRISWKYESFYKGRAKCAILQLRGKKINMYLALKPDELEGKYRAKDVSGKSLYASVPTLIKISGRRSLLYSKQLIDKLMTKLDAERGLPQKVTRVARKSTRELIDEGLIKQKKVNGSFLERLTQKQQPADKPTDAEENSDKPAED